MSDAGYSLRKACQSMTHTYVLESLTSSTRRSKGCRVGVAVEVVEDVWIGINFHLGKGCGGERTILEGRAACSPSATEFFGRGQVYLTAKQGGAELRFGMFEAVVTSACWKFY